MLRLKGEDKKLIKNTFEIIIIITLLAAMIALTVIAVANDMYALVKEDEKTTLIITEPLSLKELSRLLQQNKIIKNPTVFSMFIRSKGREDKLSSFVGEITLNSNMSYREIMLEFS